MKTNPKIGDRYTYYSQCDNKPWLMLEIINTIDKISSIVVWKHNNSLFPLGKIFADDQSILTPTHKKMFGQEAE